MELLYIRYRCVNYRQINYCYTNYCYTNYYYAKQHRSVTAQSHRRTELA